MKKENILLCKSHLIVITDRLPEDGIVIGETNSDFFESRCLLINEDDLIYDDVLRIEYYQKVRGITVGYLEVGYGEYIVLKSINKMKYRLFLLIMTILVVCDLILFVRYYL